MKQSPPRGGSVLFVVLVRLSIDLPLVKLLLPRGLFLPGLAQEGRKCPNAQETLVQPVPRLPERAREIHEQHDAVAIRVVPNLVIECVVESERLAFRPFAEPVADADAHFLARFG